MNYNNFNNLNYKTDFDHAEYFTYEKQKILNKIINEYNILEKRVRILEHENNELKNILGVEKV